MNATQLAAIQRKLSLSKSTLARNQTNGMASDAEPERVVCHESVAAPEGKAANTNRCFVRVTSFRLRLLDERNLADKYFVDALIYAGILHSDAEKDCIVKVEQIKVHKSAEQRTEIQITPII